jgi:oligopeptide/dipeptide ABC transporter ATP-binding protein
MQILEVKNLHKRFPIKKGRSVYAVNGVDFTVEQGQTLGLVGESGCGKTTVGRCVCHLLEPTEGEILFRGKDIVRLSKPGLKNLRKEIQIVFQDPYGSLNPRKLVRQILEEPLIVNGVNAKDRRLRRVAEILAMIELDNGYLEKYPIQLTQGEQQRVSIARAFITNPRLVVLDEPTSLLDVRFRGEIVLLLKRLQRETGCSYIFISHDLNVVYQISHRIAVMYLGRVVEEGPPDTVFDTPNHPYTQALLAATLFPDPDQRRTGFALKGEVPSPVNLQNDQCNFASRCPSARDVCFESSPKLRIVGEDHYSACHEQESNT